MQEIIGDVCGKTAGSLLTIWAINRVIDPESASNLEEWVSNTEIPYLSGIPADKMNKDAFLRSLDRVCYSSAGMTVDRSREIEAALYNRWIEKNNHGSTMAYDITSVLFFGTSSSIAEMGYDSGSMRKINVAILSTREGIPIMHSVYEGSRNGRSTVKNLITEISRWGIPQGLLIVDRGIMGKTLVDGLSKLRWDVIGGIVKDDAIKRYISNVDVPVTSENMVDYGGKIYASCTSMDIYRKRRRLIIYRREGGR